MAKWTAERNERFFLLVLKDVKPNYENLQKEWKERYGDLDDFQPTARALHEQYKNLCKRAGFAKEKDGKVKDTPSKPKPTPNATPSKPAKATRSPGPKTPSSGVKRSRKTMSEDDDSEGELLTNLGSKSAKRTQYDRRSKTPKTYQDPGSDSESAADEGDANDLELGGHGIGLGSIFDQELSLDGPAENAAEDGDRRKVRRQMLDEDALSDISEFKPDLSCAPMVPRAIKQQYAGFRPDLTAGIQHAGRCSMTVPARREALGEGSARGALDRWKLGSEVPSAHALQVES
ncbi:hypothetical protein LTR08_003189 [Meristemomyces frigidus]|nr:hypothetical protein LTR08_003189 [Meristemomyces frigidus]